MGTFVILDRQTLEQNVFAIGWEYDGETEKARRPHEHFGLYH